LPVTGEVDEAAVSALGDDGQAVQTLEPGDSGAGVAELQRALTGGPFDAGPDDGVYGQKTVQAVYALEKLAGLRVDGAFDGVDRFALDRLTSGDLKSVEAQNRHDRTWVEVDLSRQLMAVYDPKDPSTPVLVSHMSSGNGERWCNDTAGCRVAATPTGHFTITQRVAGWRESSLDIGRLYNPLYFRGGIALHGALSVPLYPASHGCVRLPMHIAEYLPGLLPNGTPVDVSL
jgi:lipoprotein-anchoring transpeptidase ErfK/SrfK